MICLFNSVRSTENIFTSKKLTVIDGYSVIFIIYTSLSQIDQLE